MREDAMLLAQRTEEGPQDLGCGRSLSGKRQASKCPWRQREPLLPSASDFRLLTPRAVGEEIPVVLSPRITGHL